MTPDPTDFFALEAAEALDRVEALAAAPGAPPADELLRAARLLRGAALLADRDPIARAAAALEGLLRAWRSRQVEWGAVRPIAVRAAAELRTLVAGPEGQAAGDHAARRAARLAAELEAAAGGHAPAGGGVSAQSSRAGDAGVRAFVAREAALVAATLDQAGRALQEAPTDRDALYAVIRRMQSLRGLAGLGELAPLPDVLDGIEMAMGELIRLPTPPPGAEGVIRAAAHALARIARDVADRGRPDADAPEARRFTDLLLRAFAAEDVVPIESLYPDGDPGPVALPGPAPSLQPVGEPGPLELVSRGEHLCQTADLIATARSTTERDLRLYRLVGTLRTVAPPGPDALGSALAGFARAARESLAAGVPPEVTDRFAQLLRHAGSLLRGFADGQGDRTAIARGLVEVSGKLHRLRAPEGETAEAPSSTAPGAPASRATSGAPGAVPTEALGPSDGPVVPIEALAPDDLPVVPVESLAPGEPAGAEADRRLGDGGGPEIAPEIAIEALCYRGRAALERAAEVRHALARELESDADLERLRPLLDELLDLVPLALTEA